ncbi:MAG TPA: glycosyl hydrolase family 39 [Terriglobia bacterium]|nr:glycosyl hydrolase family 39 [Terriglobia bacterium]
MAIRGLPGRLTFIVSLAILWISLVAPAVLHSQVSSPSSETVTIDLGAPSHPFPHYWERTFGSGRAVLSLRDSYRRDLREVKQATGFEYVRFHGILLDEVGLYSEDSPGNPVYNFSYVDQIYDGLLANGVRPYVELSFMPQALRSTDVTQAFWYKPYVSPPKSWQRWDGLIEQLARHLVERYGLSEVAQWYFEVWNEPNLDFWAGNPRQETYFELYDHTVRALKRASPLLRVGGPATAQAAWVAAFIDHCVGNNVPADFVSTHVYANDRSEDVFGKHEEISRRDMVCDAVKMVHDQVKASARPDLPIEWSEYNASYMNEPDVTDSLFMGPWLANTIRACDGLVDSLAYWTFSDVFEEQGVVRQPFYGGFGLLAAYDLPKPSFNAFKLLHALGTRRIPVDSDSVLATVRADGSLAIAVWNYSPPDQPGPSEQVTLEFKGIRGKQAAFVARLDADHGSLLATYKKMGSPKYPTAQQQWELRQAAQLPAPGIVPLESGRVTITLPPYGLAIIETR